MSDISYSGQDSAIKLLAERLVSNHLDLSVSINNSFGSNPKHQNYLKKELDISSRVRRTIIAVIGAGASSKAGIPTSKDAVDILEKKIKIPKEVMEYQLERLGSIFRLRRDEFETQLRALSQFNAQELRNKLQSIYNHRYIPLLGYEILAHMLKHRFLDVIINFNFDELLDQAIDDELGPEEYYKIISDGDCPDKLMSSDRFRAEAYRLDLPVYIKPHGTASYKSTMRFTRDDYYGLPNDIRLVLSNLIHKPKRPITLIVIGFGMRSFEFNGIIDKPAKKSEIFYVNLDCPSPDPPIDNYTTYLIKSDKEEIIGIGGILKKLWENIVDYFEPLYKPKSIERHILISTIFADQKSESLMNDFDIKEYLESRTKIELILSIAKAKGVINIGELDKDRCGRYYDLYKEFSLKLKVKWESLYTFCKNVGFIPSEYGHEILKWENISKNKINNTDQLLLTEKQFEGWLNNYIAELRDCYIHYSNSRYNHEEYAVRFESDARELLIGLFRNDENTEILSRRNTLHDKIFNNPTVLNTHTALKSSTHDLVGKDWDTMLVVAETGAWLTAPDIIERIGQRPNATVLVILGDESRKRDLIKALDEKKIAHIIRHMHWWEHNRHMTVLLRKTQPIASIYFTRRLRSSEISPIRLDGGDSEKILNIFCAYWIKASMKGENKVNFSQLKQPSEYIERIIGEAKRKNGKANMLGIK
jgi:hypothetical protein